MDRYRFNFLLLLINLNFSGDPYAQPHQGQPPHGYGGAPAHHGKDHKHQKKAEKEQHKLQKKQEKNKHKAEKLKIKYGNLSLKLGQSISSMLYIYIADDCFHPNL